ncbi:MAG: hypothetical protein GY791_17715 [Alphaproteobacteria bacterium]|nr:hypothetical protein [Alphaproteobacteria bacterium]
MPPAERPKDDDHDKQVQARLDLLRAQHGGGLLGIGQDSPADEARQAKEAGDDWRPPLPAPMSGFATALAIVILVLLAIFFVLF